MSALRRGVWGVVVLSSLILLGLILERNAARGRFTRAFSTYGSGPQGTRALYLTLESLGFRTGRWSQDLARLPAAASLIALGTCESTAGRALSRYEREELMSWVQRGGMLLVAGARNYLPKSLGIAFDDDWECEVLSGHDVEHPSRGAPAAPSWPVSSMPQPQSGPDAGAEDASDQAPPDELLAALAELAGATTGAGTPRDPEILALPLGAALKGLPPLLFRNFARLSIDPALKYQTLLAVPEQTPEASVQLVPLGLTFRHGQGRVIVLSSADMLQNQHLLGSEGAALFARLLHAYAPSELLIFDEYHLGLGERRSQMQYLRETGLLAVLAQLLWVASLALWREGARLGAPVRAQAVATPSGTPAFVDALGRLYARVGDHQAALRLIARGALAQIAAHYAVGNLPASALESELRLRGATRAAQAVRAIAQLGATTDRHGLVTSAQQIDAERDAALSERAGRRPSAPADFVS